jgi:hypothetical protein
MEGTGQLQQVGGGGGLFEEVETEDLEAVEVAGVKEERQVLIKRSAPIWGRGRGSRTSRNGGEVAELFERESGAALALGPGGRMQLQGGTREPEADVAQQEQGLAGHFPGQLRQQ